MGGMTANCILLAVKGLDPDLGLIQLIVGVAGIIVFLAVVLKTPRRK